MFWEKAMDCTELPRLLYTLQIIDGLLVAPATPSVIPTQTATATSVRVTASSGTLPFSPSLLSSSSSSSLSPSAKSGVSGSRSPSEWCSRFVLSGGLRQLADVLSRLDLEEAVNGNQNEQEQQQPQKKEHSAGMGSGIGGGGSSTSYQSELGVQCHVLIVKIIILFMDWCPMVGAEPAAAAGEEEEKEEKAAREEKEWRRRVHVDLCTATVAGSMLELLASAVTSKLSHSRRLKMAASVQELGKQAMLVAAALFKQSPSLVAGVLQNGKLPAALGAALIEADCGVALAGQEHLLELCGKERALPSRRLLRR